MLLDWLLIIVGLTLLLAGGEAIVRGASGIGRLARVSPSVIGLTVVAAGTSMPELFVSSSSFIKSLAFAGRSFEALAKVGVFLGSAACALLGLVLVASSSARARTSEQKI